MKADSEKAHVELDGDLLRCPKCRETCGLHHGRVTVHSARAEDKDGVQVHVENGKGGWSECPRSEFLGRRDDVVISLWCECCGGDPVGELRIVQHKGTTVMSVVLADPPDQPGKEKDD